ncbi:MAG: hypothetical protein ABI432_08710 [Flavobacteriales bacterium]
MPETITDPLLSSLTLSELLTHPRFQRVINKRVESRVRELVKQEIVPQWKRSLHKTLSREVPEGWITYNDAAKKFNYPAATIRCLVSTKRVPGGNGLINELRLAEYTVERGIGRHTNPKKATWKKRKRVTWAKRPDR